MWINWLLLTPEDRDISTHRDRLLAQVPEWLPMNGLTSGQGPTTGGSVRLPSQANGLFGMRITNASLPLDGILPISPIFDMPGLLARSPKLLQMANKGWCAPKP